MSLLTKNNSQKYLSFLVAKSILNVSIVQSARRVCQAPISYEWYLSSGVTWK